MKLTAAMMMALALVLATGCSNQKRDDKMGANPSVTDISAASAITPAPAPQQYAPPPQAQPVVYDSAQPQYASAAPTGGSKYTVRKGDTLWKIAQSHYGNGNQWQKIASANPGLSPSSLRAGQTIMLP